MNDLFSQPIQTHSHESNKEVNEFFQSNKVHFGKQAQQVLELLMDGKILTQRSAMFDYRIYSLSTRISECNKYLHQFNIQIVKGWTKKMTGQKLTRTYYLTPIQVEDYKLRYQTLVK